MLFSPSDAWLPHVPSLVENLGPVQACISDSLDGSHHFDPLITKVCVSRQLEEYMKRRPDERHVRSSAIQSLVDKDLTIQGQYDGSMVP